ncbi:MAG TPA: hypothetical protein PLF13_10845 [candidate division Zixibacteria bacterium]|nr:hypothetical protein [candidate division Zixibacteria bacterium]
MNPAIGKRIVVIGHPGSGKSTLAGRLGPILKLPVFHLDKLFWKPGWVESDREAFRRKITEVMEGEIWIIDGSYTSTLPLRLQYADTAVHLDFSRLLCMWRINRRWITSYGRVRPDLADDCPERFDWSFQRWCWRYRRRQRPLIMSALKDAPQVRTITLTCPGQVEAWLASLSPVAHPSRGC